MAATGQFRPSPTAYRPPVADTTVAGHRRGGGLRRGALRSVRVQLLAPILVAMAGLAVLGSVQTLTAAAEAADAQRARTLATTAVGTVRLVHEVERELAETTALRQRGGEAGRQLVTAQRQRTDAMVTAYRAAANRARTAVPALETTIRTADAALDGLEGARAAALEPDAETTSTSDQLYHNLSTALLAVADELPARVVDPQLANQARVVAALSAVEHYDALERALVRAILARKSLQPGELGALATLVGQRNERMAEFDRVADTTERALFSTIVQGRDVETANHLREALLASERDPSGLTADPDAWYTAQSNLIRRINLASLRLSDRLERDATRVETSALWRAWGTAIGTVCLAGAALAAAALL
ncbi:MAG: nitrate- and nitrite sensing domain-containing protein, partial [Dactylosporangium sp.]|nr:nitrate- and nitrite sensing domain-containing protein [Dactylosporangium sp.]NNJ62225.1 nitrate- and nitrite sensing domain-containing protein [Dactylosporangium sp.]